MFTYSGNPISTARDAVRFEIDDTDADDYSFEDAEIDYALQHFGIAANSTPTDGEAVFPACMHLLRIKERRLSADPTVRIGNLTIDNSAAAKLVQDLIKKLQRRLAARSGLWAGGISRDDKAIAQQDPDRPADSFKVGIHDFPGSQAPEGGANSSDPTRG